MAKSERRACPACGTWRCSDCGFVRRLASRFTKDGQTCGKCESKKGVMLPVFHTSRMKARDHEFELEFWVEKFGVAHPLQGFDYEHLDWEDHLLQPSESEGSPKES